MNKFTRSSEKELIPHRKIITECRKSLEKILRETDKLNKLNWLWKSKGYEKQLDKTTSKLKAWEDMLQYQNQAFQLKVRNTLKDDIKAIQILSKQIENSFSKKGWLKEKVKTYQPILQKIASIAKIVSFVLAIFGIEVGGLLLLAQEAAANILPGD